MLLNSIFPSFMLDDKMKKKMVKYENDMEFMNTFFNLLNIALYSFSFEGLPDTCNERYFKLCLILHGKAALINDPDIGFLTLGCTPMYDSTSDQGKPGIMNSGINIYGEWPRINAYGWNGFHKEYTCYMYGADNTEAQALICRDNDSMYPLVNSLLLYTKRMTDTMRTLDVTAKKLKTPYFIVADESQKGSIKKILEDVDFNQDSIITNRSTNPNEFNVLQSGVMPESVRVLWEHYTNLGCEVKTLLGINNATNLGKKERLVTSEAEANDILTDINIDYRMKSYEKFCETANSIFGLNLSVKSNIEKIEEKANNKGTDFYKNTVGGGDNNENQTR